MKSFVQGALIDKEVAVANFPRWKELSTNAGETKSANPCIGWKGADSKVKEIDNF